MSAPKNNQFWKLRSKHGRNKLFQTPELMLESAYNYFEWSVENPHIKIDFKGSPPQKVEIPLVRPFTMSGLCVYLGCSQNYFRNFKSTIEERENNDFLETIEMIEQIIYVQKFEGAAVGAFNANIISMDLGLANKHEVEARLAPIILSLGSGIKPEE